VPLQINWTDDQTGNPYPALFAKLRSYALYVDDDDQITKAWIVVDLYRDADAFAAGKKPIQFDIGYGVDDPDVLAKLLTGDLVGTAESLLLANAFFTDAKQVATVQKIDVTPVPEPITVAPVETATTDATPIPLT